MSLVYFVCGCSVGLSEHRVLMQLLMRVFARQFFDGTEQSCRVWDCLFPQFLFFTVPRFSASVIAKSVSR